MKIDENKILFTFYLDGNKYIVFSINEPINLGDNLYFAKEINDGVYESVDSKNYDKVLNEYKGYLESINEGEFYED